MVNKLIFINLFLGIFETLKISPFKTKRNEKDFCIYLSDAIAFQRM